MKLKEIQSLFLQHKETSLFHRYITNKHISPLLSKLEDYLKVEILGESVLNAPIYGVKIGNGDKRILMWSQMHGNEATTTKALFDLLNTLTNNNSIVNPILESCTLYIIPILSPDGAKAYTRVNANKIDLNRDAQDLTQPESRVLRGIFKSFKPHFCYNLHGQRTIFSAGNVNKSATVSFLAPAQDKVCTITPNRKIAMEIIGVMNKALQEIIPGQVGVYDDSFNINCVGDTFQCENVPTILFEAGHFENDYAREQTREFIYISLMESLVYIANNDINGERYGSYLEIPENEKLFFDIIIRNAKVLIDNIYEIKDIGIQFQEKLIENTVCFVPKVEKMENLNGFYAHNEIDANKAKVFDDNSKLIQINKEVAYVIVNNEKTSLLLK